MSDPELDLSGAVAIVTGAGSQTEGIGNGRASAIMLARHGAQVAVVDRVEEAAEQTRRTIEQEGGSAAAFLGDVSDEQDCRDIVGRVGEHLGTPTILVNNVGVAGPPGAVDEVDLEAWDAGMRVNVKSMVLMSGLCVGYGPGGRRVHRQHVLGRRTCRGPPGDPLRHLQGRHHPAHAGDGGASRT